MSKNNQEEQKLPGNISLPSKKEDLDALVALDKGTYKYSIEDYFQKPNKSDFQFAPNGLFLSFKERDDNGKNHIYVQNTESNEITKVLEEKEDIIRAYAWANNNRLIYIKDKGGNENFHLFAVDLNGENEKELTPYDNVRVNIASLLKDQTDYLIILMNKDNPQVFEPYKININTGDIEKLYENTDLENPIAGYDFDKDGNLKSFTKQQNGIEYVIYYKVAGESEFKEIITTSWKDTFGIIAFDYLSGNENLAYVVSNMESNTNEIILFDFKENKEVKKIYSNDTFDVSSLGQSRKRNYEVDYYAFNGEKQHIVPVSDYFKKLHSKIKAQFEDKNVIIASKTENEDKYLLYVTSDKLVGIYYLYDFEKDTFKELMNLMPQLQEEDMAEMRPIQFTTRDGLNMYAYLTIPKEASNENKVPLIVNPHGGPYGVRDAWRFNPETQLFASRGFATLQINYRGSGGYGKEFFLAGSKQIGRNMLNDLEDGVAYAKSLGFIQEDKIAIYGASYGGLATLGSLVKTPDLYTCGVDYVGVSNLFSFVNTIPPYWEPYKKQIAEQWYDKDNPEEEKIMRAVSPALNAEKITKPLFVIQGANDPRVNIDESDQIVETLRSRDVDVPYMVKYNEGHGFGHEKNTIELYKCMMGFFAKNLND